MFASFASRLRWPLLAAAAAALVLVTTTALAGSGVGGVFNLGQVNSVDAQTVLNGNPAGSPQLKVVTAGTGAAVRGEASNGIGNNGISVLGTGQQGQSQTGIGLLGIHSDSTGIASGIEGRTASTDTSSAGVLGRNTGGGPGLRAIVNAGAPPLMVSNQVKIANLNADKLDDLDSTAFQKRVTGTCTAGQAIRVVAVDGSVTCEPIGLTGAWSLTGNAGTNPGANFLGTTDNKALELKVNGQRALRLEPNATSPNVVGGRSGNSVLAGAVAATIGGGGEATGENLVSDDFGTIGGGRSNVAGDRDAGNNPASARDATVAGGLSNIASGSISTIGGGDGNTASGAVSFVGGGVFNTAAGDRSTVGGGGSSTASGANSAIGGGGSNSASGDFSAIAGGQGNVAVGKWSTVAGGVANIANGDFSFAAGRQAKALHPGSFVWGDSQAADVLAPGPDTFSTRAAGGFWFGIGGSPPFVPMAAGQLISTSTGAFLSAGGMWTDVSDRTRKHDFRPLVQNSVLKKVARMPITSWSYKAEKAGVRHIGPTAQDFRKAFGLGLDDKHIATLDEAGVALAAIQELYRQNVKLQRRLDRLEEQLNRRSPSR